MSTFPETRGMCNISINRSPEELGNIPYCFRGNTIMIPPPQYVAAMKFCVPCGDCEHILRSARRFDTRETRKKTVYINVDRDIR